MLNKTKKAVCILLALVMVAAVTVCCTKKGPEKDGTESAEINGVKVVDYNGANFTVICRSRDAYWGELAIAAEETDGTVLNDATYNRNSKVSSLYNINLKIDEISDSVSQKGIFYNRLVESTMATDYLADLCIPGILDACTLIPQNLFVDLQQVDEIDLSAEWWQQKINESVRLLNKQYFGFNSMMLNDKCDTYLLYFNKDNFDDNNMAYPYSYVDDGSWTNDKLLTIIKGYGADVNNDSVVDFDDKIGYTYLLNDTFFIGAGVTAARLDNEGYPYIVDLDNRITAVFDKIQSISKQSRWNMKAFGNTSELQQVLDGQGLFASFHMLHMMTIAASYQSHIGLVPCPKYDEEQTEYYSRAGFNGATCVAILNHVPNSEMSGVVTEAFAYWSEQIISPAFYEKLFTNRYTDDEESKHMLDIVIKSEVIDLDQVFQWGNMLVSISASASTGGNISSSWQRMASRAKTSCDKTISDYFSMG